MSQRTDHAPAHLDLHDAQGRRKYLTAEERWRFLEAAEQADRETRTLCYVLTYTGCRISEALALTADRVDFAEGTVIFETLKKRRPARYRAVPVPPAVLDALDLVHDVRQLQRRGRARGARLWHWHRATAWRRVVAVMRDAGIPLNMVQKWLGHAQLSTTAIYADAVGAEEHNIASRMWRQ